MSRFVFWGICLESKAEACQINVSYSREWIREFGVLVRLRVAGLGHGLRLVDGLTDRRECQINGAEWQDIRGRCHPVPANHGRAEAQFVGDAVGTIRVRQGKIDVDVLEVGGSRRGLVESRGGTVLHDHRESERRRYEACRRHASPYCTC